jgi:hypothetical protein
MIKILLLLLFVDEEKWKCKERGSKSPDAKAKA